MPIKAKPVTAEQAARTAKGFLSRAEQRTVKKGDRNYFYTDDVRERERLERLDDESSSNDSESSRAFSVKSSGSPAPHQAFLTGGASGFASASDVDSDEEALAEARRRTQAFLYPEKDKHYKKPPPQPNERLITYEKKRRENKILKEFQEEDRRAALETQAQLKAGMGGALATASPAPASGSLARLSGTSGVDSPPRTSASPHLEAHKVSSSDAPPAPFKVPAAAAGASRQESRTRSNDPLKADFDRLLQLFGQDIERERQRVAEEAASANRSVHAEQQTKAKSNARELFHVPATNLVESQFDALHQLYELWGEEKEADQQVFVATEHLGEAFAMAASHIVSSRSSGPSSRRNGEGALSMEEVAAVQVAERNARRLQEDFGPGGVVEALVEDAQQRLDRFLESVRWLERLVRDKKFMGGVAHFMHQHYKLFLSHVSESSGSSMQSFSHEEYVVFNEFSGRVSKVVFEVLSSKVRGFDEVEFAENLFDTPIRAETETEMGPMNIVSYPAWRIMLSISSFESFIAWMVDYIQEEFNLMNLEEVAVGSSRGLRALVQSTYREKFPGRSSATGSATPPDPETIPSASPLELTPEKRESMEHLKPKTPTQSPSISGRPAAQPAPTDSSSALFQPSRVVPRPVRESSLPRPALPPLLEKVLPPPNQRNKSVRRPPGSSNASVPSSQRHTSHPSHPSSAPHTEAEPSTLPTERKRLGSNNRKASNGPLSRGGK